MRPLSPAGGRTHVTMTTPDAFESLFQPVLVGRVRLKNRLVVPPMGTQFADPSGAVTNRLIA
jgi:2,4-dienoyl-CoA reductase-like NADH-dependent reductase (Old Yellow Enzyme family)